MCTREDTNFASQDEAFMSWHGRMFTGQLAMDDERPCGNGNGFYEAITDDQIADFPSAWSVFERRMLLLAGFEFILTISLCLCQENQIWGRPILSAIGSALLCVVLTVGFPII